MAGGFDDNNPPVLAGFYSKIRQAQAVVAASGEGRVAAILASPNWGPEGEVVSVRSEREYDAVFGKTDNDARLAVIGALTGTGAPDSGASEVKVYRYALSGNTAASLTLDDGVPDPALTITAKYKGTLGDSLAITVRSHPTEVAMDEIIVFLNNMQVESYTYPEASTVAAAALINAESAYITAASTKEAQLAPVSAQPLTGGANGVLTVGDVGVGLADLETEDFNIISLAGVSDPAALAALRSWVINENATARRILAVTGGPTGESFSAAGIRSALSSDSEDIVNAGFNVWTDGTNTYSSAQMVGYYIGMIAGAGARRAITFDLFPPEFTLTDSGTPTRAQLESAVQSGVLIAARTRNGVRVQRGNTTFTLANDPDRPLEDFGSIKSVRAMHYVENTLTEAIEGEWIGKIPNTPATRSNLVGEVKGFLKDAADSHILKVGSTDAWLDESYDNTGGTIHLRTKYDITSAIERVLNISDLTV